MRPRGTVADVDGGARRLRAGLLDLQHGPDRPFNVRWGRYNGVNIRRNFTCRTREIQEQSRFEFAVGEQLAGGETWVTLGHTIEDEHTEAGKPCIWIGRIMLLRERPDESEVITEVHRFEEPSREEHGEGDLPSPFVVARQSEVEEWEQMIRRIRGASA